MTATLSEGARGILEGCEVHESEADDGTLARCEVLMAWPTRAGRDLLKKMTGLRMVQAMSAGVDGLDFEALPAGVVVCSNAGAFTEAVAEHAWGLLMGAAKGLHSRKERVVPRRLGGGTLLVIGAGSIGSEIARLARSVKMKTIGVSRSFADPGSFDEEHGVAELEGIIGRADAIAIALPLTKRTSGLIGYGTLMRSKEAVTVVNVGRGEVVSEEGLIRWLTERPESRYVTDVFWKKDGRETFETGAWDLPNFSGTLHISGVPLGEKLERPMTEAATNVVRFLETGDALNKVDLHEYV